MRARGRRSLPAVLIGLVAVLGIGLGVGIPAAVADDGTLPPVIISPTPSDLHYAGFHGPFLVDFTNSPPGTYSYGISPTQPGDSAHQYVWTGSGQQPASFAIPALPQGSYTFDVSDGAGHEASLAFDVRGPQPRCTLVVPAVIRVNAPEMLVIGRLAADCARAHVGYASWDVRHATQGFVSLFSFNHATRDVWKYGAFADPLGTYYAVPTVANGAGDDDIGQNAPRTTIRLAARLRVTATRAGRLVTLRGVASRYAPKALGFRAWQGRRVTISYRNCPTCAWRVLATRTTDGRGAITLRVRSGVVRGYRLTMPGTSSVWAPGAATVRR